MLNTIFKVFGIIFFLLGIMALLTAFFMDFSSSNGPVDRKEAQVKAELSVTKAEPDGDKIILLLNVKNNSDINLILYGLVINIVGENNKIIDKCSVMPSEMVPRSVSANSDTTVLKVICKNMQIAAKYRGDVKYIPKFESMF